MGRVRPLRYCTGCSRPKIAEFFIQRLAWTELRSQEESIALWIRGLSQNGLGGLCFCLLTSRLSGLRSNVRTDNVFLGSLDVLFGTSFCI